jgi:hypothetical protein
VLHVSLFDEDVDADDFLGQWYCTTLYPTVLLSRYLRVSNRPTADLRPTATNGGSEDR